MRKAAYAGHFYPASTAELKKQLSGFFSYNEEKKALAIIAPHAGYQYSGKIAAQAYSALADAQTFVLIGVNHSGMGNAISLEDFATPIGTAKNDKELGKSISKESGIGIEEGEHAREHSIEVQLPFLLFSKKNFSIVPIILSNYSYETCKRLARAIIKAAKKEKKRICLIASSDFTHYGYNYGFFLEGDAKQNIYAVDKNAINEILNFDAKSFLERAMKTTICGAGAIATCIEASKILGAKKAKLLDYKTSGDIIGDYSSAVGYAAISFT